IEHALTAILDNEQMNSEILEVLQVKYNSLKTMEIEHDFDFPTPLTVHSTYSREQVLAALGYFNEDQCPAFRAGVKYFKDKKLDVFFVTLNKSEKDYSPSTLYEDYAINERLFHWQSQSQTSEQSTTRQRFMHQKGRGQTLALCVREYRSAIGYTSPVIWLCEWEYVRQQSEKRSSFVWRMKGEMPPALAARANKSVQ